MSLRDVRAGVFRALDGRLGEASLPGQAEDPEIAPSSTGKVGAIDLNRPHPMCDWLTGLRSGLVIPSEADGSRTRSVDHANEEGVMPSE